MLDKGNHAVSEAKRIVLFGNSGSGKSTLSRHLSEQDRLEHLDLDSIAWLPVTPPTRKPIEEAAVEIRTFLQDHKGWVIEGCYSDLLEMVLPEANEMIFLNLPVEACVDNAKARPWEPHKYESKQAQDANLEMLIDWIRQYAERDDTFSKSAHEALFAKFQGNKTMHTRNLSSAVG